MKLNLFILIAALLGFIFGLGFLLAPVWSIAPYGIDLSQNITGQFLGRYLGSALVALAVTWVLARGAKSEAALKKAGLLGGLVLGVTGLVVAVWDSFAGMGNSFTWVNAVIYAFLAIGFAYFYFKK
jgi:hypothetical protein